MTAINKFYKDKVILVTGGAGSIGSELVRELLTFSPRVVRALDNNETGLFNLGQTLNSPKLRLLVGDVRDKERLQKAVDGADIVFHAAALKHVHLCEFNPFEAVRTNVVGTQNVIDTALSAEVEKFINISTDKAAKPTNVMGASKLLAERLTTAASHYKGDRRTVLSSVRFGNVLNSRGSVVPVVSEQIRKGGPVTITNPEMTRFVMSIPKAVSLVLLAAERAEGGEIFVLKMPAVKIGDLIKVMVERLAPVYGHDISEVEINVIGERVGEKLHEELITSEEAELTEEHDDLFVITLDSKTQKKTLSRRYRSDENELMLKNELRKLIDEVLDFQKA